MPTPSSQLVPWNLGYYLTTDDIKLLVDGFDGLPRPQASALDLDLNPRRPKGPQMSAIALAHFLTIVAFLAEPVSKALVEEVATKFFKRLIFPRLAPLFRREKKAETLALPLTLRPTMWLDVERVCITVIMRIVEAKDFALSDVLVPRAFQLGYEWLASHGRTHPFLTFRIHSGKLSPIPTLSEEPIE